MKNILKTISYVTLAFILSAGLAFAAISIVPNGGTGVGTLTGIVKGNGTSPFSAATTTGSGSVVLATLPTLTTPTVNNMYFTPSGTAAEQFYFYGKGGAGIPVPFFYPNTANTALAFDISPNGTPGNTYGIGPSWIDLLSTDVNNANYEVLRLSKRDGGNVYITSAQGGTGSYRDMSLQYDYSTSTIAGKVGIGLASETANLDITPSTTGAAALRIRSGSTPSSPNSGDMWQDGTHLYAYINGASRQLDQQSGGSGSVTSVATDATLTGGPITTTGTLGLNLANANTWTALQTIQLATEQLRLGFDATNNAKFTVSSGGVLTIAATGSSITFGSQTFTAGNIIASSAINSPIFRASANNAAISLQTSRTFNAAITSITNTASSVTNSTGLFTNTAITSTYTQTGSASATDFLISRTESSVGSGTQLLFDAQVGGVSKFNISNAGLTTTTQNALGTTTADALLLNNTTAAALGAQQISPSLHLMGNGWGTTAGTSQSVDYRIALLPVQGTTPTGSLQFMSSVNGGAYTTTVQITGAGNIIANGALVGGNASSNSVALGTINVSNLVSFASNVGASSSNAALLFGGATNVNYRNALAGSTSTAAVTAGNNYANTIVGAAALSTAATGTHAWLTNFAVTALGTVTSNGAAITNTASLYIDGASSAGSTNYALYVASGLTFLGGHLNVEGVTSTGATGTGKLVFDTSPTFTTPVLGAASGTSLTLSTPGTSSTDVPNLSSTNTFTNKRITPRIGTETSSSTSTPTADSVDQWNVTALAAADAFAAPTGTPTNGQGLIIRIKDNGTARALTWNAIYRASSDLALPSTTIISKTMYLKFLYNAADSKWDFVSYLNNF